MPDPKKTGKDLLGMTKAELIARLEAQEAKIARAEAHRRHAQAGGRSPL